MARVTQWGDGIAPLVSPATTEETELVVLLSDLHFPYADAAVLKSALKLIKKVNPHRVVLNGDVNDFFQLSRFNTAMERVDELQDDIDVANAFREKLRLLVPNAVIDENEGNHDNRVRTYIAKNARSLTSLRALEPEYLFRYDDLQINWHPGHGFRIRPEFLVKHGTIVRQDSGYAAKAELMLNGISGISGHTHRLGKYSKNGYINREWSEQGCLCRLDPDYIIGAPNWKQGLAIGQFSTTSGFFCIELVEFKDGNLIYGGKLY